MIRPIYRLARRALQSLRSSAIAVEEREARFRFLARFHPLCCEQPETAGRNCFITCSGKRDRAGAQALAVLSTMLFAERAGMQYLHTPFQHIGRYPDTPSSTLAHDDAKWAVKWEKFFNLGKGELLLNQMDSLPLERMLLSNPSRLPLDRSNMLYTVRHSHEYANAFPDEYLRIVGRFEQKYYSSPKEDLPMYYDPSRLNIAVHVRRGDVAADNSHASRYTTNEYTAALVREVLGLAGGSGLPPAVHLYSEGKDADFGELLDMGIAFHLNECPFATFHNLVRADVLLMSKSTFSYVAALLSHGVKVYESFRGTPLDHKPLRHWIVADCHGRLDRERFAQALEARALHQGGAAHD